ncbi:hypothetical protein IVA79_16265 [Bradyrhizobium sp. 138]|uniref:YunG family protein n=1 Tax=Bradyrhizobium sp. 138 TaxID=2782615 RepID=UPI001FF877D2|nr:hypothetical protein [Bradyrhizobium sp. 138]MCK1735490.1 hypothetical protein [Bradyrhizobium sp. 138]
MFIGKRQTQKMKNNAMHSSQWLDKSWEKIGGTSGLRGAGTSHFYDLIEGKRCDFTASQFERPIAYMDLPASRTEAELGAACDQLAELRAAF